MEQQPDRIYLNKIEELNVRLKALNKKHVRFGMVKLVWIVSGILGMFRVFPISHNLSLALLAFSVVAFVITIFPHETVIRKIKFTETLKQINENELIFLDHKFPERLETGEEFKDGEHNYTSDLDIFGLKGIFHFVNRAVTAMGRRCLAGRLKTQAEPGVVRERQGAVKELAGLVDLRQTAAAHGLNMQDSSKKLDAMYRFLDEPYFLKDKKGLIAFIYIWPVFTLAAAIAIAFKLPVFWFLLLACTQLLINQKYFKRANDLYKLIFKSNKTLKAYLGIIREIEKESFKSPLLNKLKDRLSDGTGGGGNASAWIHRLSVILEWFDTRNGQQHIVINNVFFWDLHCIYRIEKWRMHVGQQVKDWFNVVAEFEDLSSFAALSFNNPDWSFPEITEGPFQMRAEAAGHMLIPPGERVDNDVELGATEDGNVLVVTGPNMAGKSTFLRTIGVNIVLAFAGGPVCARLFTISRLHLFTSMQTSDSLDKHMSLFYAELARLKMILDGISRGEPVFFMIDEMLKGTNALDRQKGAIALVKQLLKNRAAGIVATHDLQLTKLTEANYHFDGYIEGDKLLFDYLLKTGTCESFNALALMKNMGIEVF